MNSKQCPCHPIWRAKKWPRFSALRHMRVYTVRPIRHRQQQNEGKRNQIGCCTTQRHCERKCAQKNPFNCCALECIVQMGWMDHLGERLPLPLKVWPNGNCDLNILRSPIRSGRTEHAVTATIIYIYTFCALEPACASQHCSVEAVARVCECFKYLPYSTTMGRAPQPATAKRKNDANIYSRSMLIIC